MPWRPIQAQPAGLLGFLQLKNAGRNPEQLSETLLPTMDLVQWYLESDVRLNTGATAALASGTLGQQLTTTTTQVVPSNEQWILRGISIGADLVAGDAISAAPIIRDPTLGQFRLLGPFAADGVYADNAQFRAAWNPNGDIVIARPGTRFGAYTKRFLVAAPTLINCYVVYTPMPV